MSKSTVSITSLNLNASINALAKNKDGNHVAAAGRTGKLPYYNLLNC